MKSMFGVMGSSGEHLWVSSFIHVWGSSYKETFPSENSDFNEIPIFSVEIHREGAKSTLEVIAFLVFYTTLFFFWQCDRA